MYGSRGLSKTSAVVPCSTSFPRLITAIRSATYRTVSMSWDDFMALSNGQLDPMMAFMQGKLKIAGDMMIAQKLIPLLKR